MDDGLTRAEFAALLAPLGPWPPGGRVAVAVSGGADSLCLAWLVKGWGQPVALIIDHALRPEAAAEAAETATRLAGFGVSSHTIRLHHLRSGPGLAARARAARYAALTAAAADLGLTDLLLGHHAGDQAETVLMRQAAQSGAAGLAAMPAIAERGTLRLVRPLLAVGAGRLRATLRSAGLSWAEDPSNLDLAALRPRLRAQLADPAGDGPRVRALTDRAAAAAAARAHSDRRIAAILAERASLFPEGHALLTPGPIDADSLAALIRALGGRPYGPSAAALRRLAAQPCAGTLGGIRLLPAGRLGPGTLLVREESALGPPVIARDGAIWDGRFLLSAPNPLPPGLSIAALGRQAADWRHLSPLPAAILRTLPALKVADAVVAIPHLPAFHASAGFTVWTNLRLKVTLVPLMPAAGAAWRGVWEMGGAEPAQAHHVRLQNAGPRPGTRSSGSNFRVERGPGPFGAME